MRWVVLTIILCTYHIILSAQVKDKDVVREHRASVNKPDLKDSIPTSFVQKLDYLYTAWYVGKQSGREYSDSVYIAESWKNIPTCSDATYLSRLDSLKSAIPLSYNEIVRNYIELYVVKKRFQVANMLGLSEYYFPIFEEALDAENMPLELKYLPVIESALNPRALSRAGACGLWQFMYSTGKMYKLEINSYVDERRDPVLATKAAVGFLKDLYNIYEDWILVIAAYNCGPGNVNKAIRRSGDKKNYWDIYYNLPKETRGYVPAFIAAMYAFKYHARHGILPIEPSLPKLCDSIIIEDALHFDQISGKLQISNEQLRDLNPQYRADVIPAGLGKSYALRMPYNYINDFIDQQDSIFACNRSKYFNDNDRMADPKDRIKTHAHTVSQDGDKIRLVYTVKSGDAPGVIANRYGVTLADLRYWNNLNSKYLIKPNQKLVIYVSERKASQFKNNAAYAGKVSNQADAPKVETIDGEFTTYTVQKGETLYSISKKYPGVTDQDIMKWNGIDKDIKPGQVLKIKI